MPFCVKKRGSYTTSGMADNEQGEEMEMQGKACAD